MTKRGRKLGAAMKMPWAFVLVLANAAPLLAAQYTYTGNNGGTVTQTDDTALSMTGVSLGNPAGTISLSCSLTRITPQYPYYSQWSCSGGNLSVQSTDGTLSITGTFVSGFFDLVKKTVGFNSTYYYYFYGNFAGALTVNGASLAVIGSISETLLPLDLPLTDNGVTGTIQTGLIDASQRYEPVYIADTGNNRIVQVSDIFGSNWVNLGKLGSGVKQFSAPWGIALDSSGKIYVSDSGNCRIVRMDNLQGANWISFGTCGSGTGQFSSPQGLSLDSTGRIYVADSGNNRIVRMDDITGAGWVTLGTIGSGTDQFNGPTALTTDSSGNIYVADGVNARIVEMADMSGTNWTTLQYPVGYLVIAGIALDSTNRIYFTDSLQNQFFRVDNIAGANPLELFLDYKNPSSVFVDPDGAAYLADTGNNRVQRYFDMSFTDVFSLGTSGTGVGNLSQPHGLVAVPQTANVAVAAVAPVSLKFPTELVGTSSPVETALLTNIGTAPFSVKGVTSSSADFPVTSDCPSTLAPGQSCTGSVTFQPTTGGLRKGRLTFSLRSAKSQSVSLSGSGALVTVMPPELIMFFCQGGTVTVTNPLSTSTSIKSIRISGPFHQTNDCSTLGPGESCTINVTWCSSTPITGVLSVTDASGTPQYVSLTGEQ